MRSSVWLDRGVGGLKVLKRGTDGQPDTITELRDQTDFRVIIKLLEAVEGLSREQVEALPHEVKVVVKYGLDTSPL